MATGPGGSQIIGKVAVKVIPDTSDFRSEAKKKLEAAEKSLPKVKIQAEIDSKGLKREALLAVRELNAELKTRDAYKVKFRASIDSKNMARDIRAAVRDMNKQANATGQRIKLKVDTTLVDIAGELDRASLDKVKHELEDWRDDNSPLKIHVQPEMLAGASSLVSARLSYLTRPRTVPIVPVMDEGALAAAATALAALSGARVLGDAFEDIWDFLKELDRSVPKIATLSTAVVGLSGYLLAGASNAFALGDSLAQIAGAGLALPGILGGMAVGIGVSIAAFKDFNKELPFVADRLHDLQDSLSSRFWDEAREPIADMVRNLWPAFAKGVNETATALGGFFGTLATNLEGKLKPILSTMFDDLNESIRIATGTTDNFASIIATLGSVGAGMLPRLASWFDDISTRFDHWLLEAKNNGSLQEWIDNGIQSLKDLGGVIAGTSRILAGLADAAQAAGGSSLGDLSKELNDIADAVAKPAFQRELTETLQAAHDAMYRISEISGPAVSEFFDSLANTLQRVLPLVGNILGVALSNISTALSQASVTDGLVEMFDGIQLAVNSLAPAMAPMGDMIGSLASVIGALAANLGGVFAAAIIALAPMFTTITSALTPLINMLGPILVSVISALSPVFDTFGDTFAKVAEAAAPLIERIGVLANEALPVLVPVLQAVVTFLGSALVGVINGAIKAFDGIASVIQGFVGVVMGVVAILQGDFREGFSKIWSGLGKIVNGAFKLIVGIVQVWLNVGILSVVRKGVAKILTSWKSGWGGVEKAFMAVARWIRSAAGSLWSWLRSAVGKLMSGIKSLWQGGWTAIRNVAKTVWNAIKSTVTSVANSIRNGIKSFLSRIDDTWTASWNNVKDVLRRAWDAMKNIVSTAKDRVISTVRSLPAAIQSIFSGMGSLLVNAGRSLIDGLIGGISEKFQAVKDKLSGLTKMLPDWKGPAEKDAVLLKPAGQLLIDGLIDGFESRFGAVRKTLQSLTGDIQGQVSGVEGSLSNARIRASASVTHSVDTAASSGSANKTLIYNAAPGASLGTEEDLYAALDRGRAFDW